MSVFTHLSLSPINIAAALCPTKAYNSAYAKGEQMINETMYARGAESSIIREIFSYGLERKAQIGAENVFDFSLGNPSVPAPVAVAESIKKALELPSDQLHGYTPAPGLLQCRTAVVESLNRRFGTSYEGKDVFMTVARRLRSPARSMPLRTRVTRSLLSPRTSRSIACGLRRPAVRVSRRSPMKIRSS